MSLPASLTTDCGGLLNRRGPGRKCCCHTDALHAGYHVYSSHGLFLSRIIELVYFHTENHGVHGCQSRIFFFCPELSNFFSHGESRRSRSYCPEFANCRIFRHTENRGGHGGLSRDLSFGPTDQREVIIVFLSSHGESRRVSGFMSRIIELSNFFLHTDGRGGYEGGTIEA